MTNRKYKKYFHYLAFLFVLTLGFTLNVQKNVFAAKPKPIVISQLDESVEARMKRLITLDVRDMNIVDVIKFLALKGDFNIVISPSVEGRITVLLNSVTIKDALDIAIISNNLAYKVSNNIIQVMTSAEHEAMYGERFSDQTNVHIVRLNYSKPSYVLAALDNIKSNVGKIIIDEDTGSVVMIDTDESIKKMKEAIIEIEKPLETFVYSLQYASADSVSDKLRSRIDAKAVGSISSDDRSNKLIVRAYPNRRTEIEQIIKELDAPTKEVVVEAKILQISMKPDYDVGIDWELDFRGSSNNGVEDLSFKNYFLGSQNSGGVPSNLSSNFGQIAVGDFDSDQFEATIRAHQSVSDTKTLSNPQLLIVNNEEARIHVGDTVPYIISTTSGTGDSAITSEDVRFVDVGLKLNVRPTINDDGFVTMRLRPEISSVVDTLTSKNSGGIPQVNKTEVETTVMVKDGNTIIMGGLKKDDKAHQRTGLPVLQDIPWMGSLFSRTDDDFDQTEIVIFITPKIVNGTHDYQKMKGGIKPFKEYSSD